MTKDPFAEEARAEITVLDCLAQLQTATVEAITATAVLALSLGVSDLFNSPNHIATQNTINGYSQYLSAGLVNYAQSSLK